MTTWLGNLRGRGLAARAAMLALAVLVVFVPVGPVAVCIGGCTALAAAAVAAVFCLAGATIALMASHLLRGPKHALAALLAGMTARMGIPLAFGLAIHLQGGPLAEAGLLYYLLVFYPVALAAETALSLPPPGNMVRSISSTKK
jgi:hypothetical protein